MLDKEEDGRADTGVELENIGDPGYRGWYKIGDIGHRTKGT